jgi:5-methylcytosine-specific restriction endonuclease McrA
MPKRPSTLKDRNRAKQRTEFLKKTDPLKLKARNLRSGFRTRSKEGINIPTTKEIEEWLKSISNFVCHYTGVPLDKNDFSVDHKIPLDRGGDNSFKNLCICTKQMNTTKGTMTEKEFKQLLSFLSKWEDKGEKLLRRLRMAGKAFGNIK